MKGEFKKGAGAFLNFYDHLQIFKSALIDLWLFRSADDNVMKKV